ncbi:hypothetical protein HPB49_009766 [Dermacentor silvarum]|uniref:Uncharacterized protein n=1 Tax=Dermacentor silvarum TaxID=543639 RepID=A0ACB8CEG8_DERSI|nr:hypothetical protein HPB49_009766 [Dermacentor silvarum]
MAPKRQFGKYLWDSSVEVPSRSKYTFKKRSFGADSAPVAMSEEDSADGSDTEADDARCLAHAGSNQSTEPRCVEHCPSQSCDPSLSPCEDASSSGSESEPGADLEPDHSERQCMEGWKDELGAMGWSSFTAIVAVAKATYENRLLRLPGENVARQAMVHTIFADKSTKWTRRATALSRRFGLPTICLEEAAQKQRDPMGRRTRLQVRQREAATWRKAAEEKSSLELYRSEKLEIRTECCYDNSKGSALLAEARVGVLRTRIWRARFTEGVCTPCALCGKSDETLCHMVLECGGIFPPGRTRALSTARGFKTKEVGAAEVTKKRLEFWWQHGALRR